MTVRLVDRGWGKELSDAILADKRELRIVSPFIKRGALNWVATARPNKLRVITRFSLDDFASRASDIAAVRELLRMGATIRGIKNLHAKLYVFGESRAILTSANLTSSGLGRNHEFGMAADEREVIRACTEYFEGLWSKKQKDLTDADLARWEETLAAHLATGGWRYRRANLPDFGADVGLPAIPPPEVIPSPDAETPAFVKFLGQAHDRAPLSHRVIDELRRSGCHWAVAYPSGKRPRSVTEGSTVFIARLTDGPSDMRIFGRAIGMKYVRGRDDATPADIRRHPWKKIWPHYIRVHDAEFVDGSMDNGVSLGDLMDRFQARSFQPTKRNQARGQGNTNPRRAYLRQAAVELSPEAARWLNAQLERAFAKHGRVSTRVLDTLDWPTLPRGYRA